MGDMVEYWREFLMDKSIKPRMMVLMIIKQALTKLAPNELAQPRIAL